MVSEYLYTAMINILLIHQNLPSQFNNLITFLLKQKNVNLIGVKEKNPSSPFSNHSVLRGMNIVEYTLNSFNREADNYLVTMLDNRIARGQLVGQIAKALKQQNFYPDVIIGHTGWGETMFLKGHYPDAKLVWLQEYFYGPNAPDINFDPEFQVDDSIIEISNINRLTDIHACLDADVITTPTQWQASLIPTEFQPKVKVVHDGIRTDIFCPNDDASFILANGKTLTKKDKVITYIARGLEPYRGYHIFLRAIPEIQHLDPDIEIVIVGNDGVYYSPKLPDGSLTYREHYLKEIESKVNMDKIHFYSNLPQDRCLSLMQISTLHTYFTYPFYSSLTILEAMSCGCVVLGSATGPVQEFITDKRTGYLFNFFDYKTFANKAVEIVNQHPDERYAVGQRARNMIKGCLDWTTQIEPFWERFLKLNKA